jgi:hypothetical protein
MGVFDQAEKLEQGQSPKIAGKSVFDQAEQLDAPKSFSIPTVGLAGEEEIGAGPQSNAPNLNPSTPSTPPSLSDRAMSLASSAGNFGGDLISGVGKGAAKTFYGLARWASDPNQFDDEQEKQHARAFQQKYLTPPSDIEPKNLGEKIGNVGESVGEFLLPAGEVAKGAEATKAVLGGGRLARLAALGVRSAGEGAFGALQEYAKSGGDEEKARAAGLTQAGTSAALGGVGAVASKLGGRTLANLLQTAQSDFRYGRDPVEAVRNSGIVANSMSDLRTKLATELGKTGQVIGDVLDLSPNAKTFDRAKAAQMIRDSAATHAGSLERFGGDGSSIWRMGANLSEEAANSATLRELHELKTEIGKQVRWAGESQIENARQEALKEMYGKLNSFIDANAPGVKDTQAHYGGILTAGKAVDKEIARRAGAKFNLPFFSVAGLGLGLETGHPAVGSIGLMTRAANAALKQPALVTRLAKLGDPTYAPMARAGARYLLSRFGIRPFVEDNSEGNVESRDSYAGQK